MSIVSNLPNELITLIMKQVDPTDYYSCVLVNKSFHTVTKPLLWCSINVKNGAMLTQVLTGLAESKLPMGRYVRQISLPSSTTDNQLLALMKHARHLTELTVENGAPHLTDASIQCLPAHCTKLSKLILPRTAIRTPRPVLHLARHCRLLSVLELTSAYPTMASKALLVFSDRPLKKLTLTLGGNHGINTNNIIDNTNNAANSNTNSAANINTNVNNTTRMTTTTTSLNNNNNQEIWDRLAGFTDLQHLHLTMCSRRFTLLLITRLTEHPDWFPSLTDLTLDGCQSLTQPQAVAFLETHRHLAALGLRGLRLTDTFLQAVARTLPRLTRLDVSYGRRMSGDGIRHLLFHSPWLEALDISGCRITFYDIEQVDTDDDDWSNPQYVDKLGKETIERLRSWIREWEEYMEYQIAKWEWQDHMANGSDDDDYF